MRNSRLCRITASLIAACVLLSACGGAEEKGGAASTSTDTTPPPIATTNTYDVVIQMTGLLLIVPPEKATDPVQIYFPRAVGHSALFGFAVPQGDTVPPRFCDNTGTKADTKDICYVDLAVWALQPFGDGGTLPTITLTQYPGVDTTGLVNVTHLSGGRYKAFHQRALAQSDASVTLLSGQLGGVPCKLAKWHARVHHETGSPGDSLTDSLSNVVYWGIPGLDSARAQLVFISRNPTQTHPDTVIVRLPEGDTRLLLAHIPVGDRARLPPDSANTVTIPTSNKADFEPFYDLLSMSNTPGSELPQDTLRRSMPTLRGGRKTSCPITLQSGAQIIDEFGSMATYACIPALGQGGT
jgi:hypothetical protein